MSEATSEGGGVSFGIGSDVAGSITNQIAPLLLGERRDPLAAQQFQQARQILSRLQDGKVDKSLLTSDAIAYFTPQVLADAASSLKPLGSPDSFQQTATGLGGGMAFRGFRIHFSSGKTLGLTIFSIPDGKFEQYLIQ